MLKHSTLERGVKMGTPDKKTISFHFSTCSFIANRAPGQVLAKLSKDSLATLVMEFIPQSWIRGRHEHQTFICLNLQLQCLCSNSINHHNASHFSYEAKFECTRTKI